MAASGRPIQTAGTRRSAMAACERYPTRSTGASIATLVTVWTAMLSIFRPHELYLSCAARQTLAYCNRKAIVRRTEAHPNDEFLPDSTLKSKQHSVREI